MRVPTPLLCLTADSWGLVSFIYFIMKTNNFYFVLITAMVVIFSFSACGSDDDNSNGGTSTVSIEGTWTAQSQKWYGWDKINNEPDMSNLLNSGENVDSESWIITKNGENYNFRIIYKDNGKDFEEYGELIHVSGNEYKFSQNNGKAIKDRIVFKNITSNTMVAEYSEYFYIDNPNISKAFGVINLIR